jgi:Homeodomain-like domain
VKRLYVAPQVVTRASAISDYQRTRIMQLKAEGLSIAVISERLGLHRNTVSKWALRLCPSTVLHCSCGRRVKLEARCYVCRGYRERTREQRHS